MAKSSKPAQASDHLGIWSQLETTPPEVTKQFSRGGGFKGTAINPNYVAERLTELFGPCGEGWRFVLAADYFEEGHTLPSGDKVKIHIVRGFLEYKTSPGGDWNRTGPQFGQTTFVGENRTGVFTDEEAAKKSVTDCMTKCAAMLGLAADIFSGRWDSNKYINEPEAKAPATRVPKKKAAAVDAAVVTITTPAADWTPGDWANYLAEIDNPDAILDALGECGKLGGHTEEHYAAFADRLRATPGMVLTPAGKEILVHLKAARAALDGEAESKTESIAAEKPSTPRRKVPKKKAA